jgi:sortase (surface protein transpeptidase)
MVVPVLLTVLCLALVGGALSVSDAPTAPAPITAVPQSPATEAAAHVQRPAPRVSPPRTKTPEPAASPDQLLIPAIGVDTRVVELGLQTDSTVQVPQDADDAGWYKLGPSPGANGSAVILGHVDSEVGPAVFYRVSELVPGDRIQVGLSDGAVATFAVARMATYANEDFPAHRVYAGSARRPTLVIVTCGGEYDRDNGGYQSNVVAYARHVRTSQR